MAASVMESLFQRSLDDLVNGLRVQVIGEARYVSKAVEDIRKEIRSTDLHIKAVAVQKLTYLHMLQAVDMSWAAFHVVEVMSSSKFSFKKIGYLAASQSFHEGTEVLLLITNLLRKDLGSKNEYEAGLALDCLSRIATLDLARDLTSEIFTMLSSSRLYVRKKATLVLFRVFSKYPDSIKIAFKRLVEKLEDSDIQVVSAAVTVLCELALADPKPYLPLAPEFYRILTNSSNNWLSIKLVKIFGALCPIEPRLGCKIVESVCEQMKKTAAKSLIFECIRTVTKGLSEHTDAVKMAVEKLKEFIAEEDPNLRYLGLQTLSPLMPSHNWALIENKLAIVKCLKDGDPSIQVESLRLITVMVSQDNAVEIVEILLQYARSSDPIFSEELIVAILSTCSRNIYDLITDFTWYVRVLGTIARLPNCGQGAEVERQLVDIGLRVKSVRGDLLKVCRELLMDSALLDRPHLHKVLSAAAWVVGQFVELVHNPFEIIESLIQPRTKFLPASVHAVYLQSVLKVFVFSVHACFFGNSSIRDQGGAALFQEECEKSSIEGGGDQEDVAGASVGGIRSESNVQLETRILNSGIMDMLELVQSNVSPLVNNGEMEVQERACNLLGLVHKVQESILSNKGHTAMDVIHSKKRPSVNVGNVFPGIQSIFFVELGPVSLLAQSKVTIPEGLDLISSLDELGIWSDVDDGFGKDMDWDYGPLFLAKSKDASTSGQTHSLALHREKHGTFYLPSQAQSGDNIEPFETLQEDAAMLSTRLADSFIAEPKPFGSKPSQARVRPVVIRLEEEEILGCRTNSRKDHKGDILSATIRQVLVENEPKSWAASSNRREAKASTSKHHRRSHRLSKKHDQNEHEDAVQTEVLCSNETVASWDMGEHDLISADSKQLENRQRSTARHKHSKNQVHFTSKDNKASPESEGHRSFPGQNKEGKALKYSRQRARSPLNTQPEAYIIPDFLL